MFMSAGKIIGAGSNAPSINKMFKVNTRTGTGASAPITGLLFAPDLYIGKGRSNATGWGWYDTTRGTTKEVDSSSTAAQTTAAQGITAFNSDGVTIGTLAKLNTNAATYVDYLFKKKASFLDVVTYTGNGTTSQTLSHALGVVPGMMIVKDTTTADSWYVWHRGLSSGYRIVLNSTSAQSGSAGVFYFGDSVGVTVDPTSTQFTVGTGIGNSGEGYIAYLFAHDTSPSSKIYCGTFTTDVSGNATVSGLPFQPQFVIIKISGGSGGWYVLDTSRGWGVGNDALLQLQATSADSSGLDYGAPTSNGFTYTNGQASLAHIYMAINSI